MSSNVENRERRPNPALLRRRRRGQGLVEMALVLPFLLVLTLGIVDVGVLIADQYNILYSTREAARVGAAGACFDPNPDYGIVQRVAAVLRNKPVGDIGPIDVFKADVNGNMGSAYQEYIITSTNPSVVFYTVTHNWLYTVRHNNPDYLAASKPGDWLGVKVRSTHHPITLIGQAFWGAAFSVTEKTIMRIEPPEKADGTTDCQG